MIKHFGFLLILGSAAAILTCPVAGQESDMSSSRAQLDTDGDGFTDEQEIAWSNDPADPNNHPLKNTEPAAHWRFDQSSGATATDVSGNEQSAVLKGSQLPQWDPEDAALKFDGIQNYVEAPNSGSVNLTNNITLLVWIRASVGSEGLILGKWPEEGTSGSYGLAIQEGRLALALSFNGQYRPLFGQKIVADGDWHFVAATSDGGEVSIYIDGVLDVRTHTGGGLDPIDQPLLMGLFEGKLSDVRIYHQALSEGEIILLHQLATESVSGQPALRAKAPRKELQAAASRPSEPSPVIRLRAIQKVAGRKVAR